MNVEEVRFWIVRWLRLRRPVVYRRRWCAWRRHPVATWAPIVFWYQDTKIKAYRCAVHDKREKG